MKAFENWKGDGYFKDATLVSFDGSLKQGTLNRGDLIVDLYGHKVEMKIKSEAGCEGFRDETRVDNMIGDGFTIRRIFEENNK